MRNYEYNDYELLDYIAENNEDATSILFEKYKFLIESIAKSKLKNNTGLDYNDLVQEGMIGLNEAIRDFKDQKDVTFYTFASICIERQILSAIKGALRNKHKTLNSSISLDYAYDLEDESNLYNNIEDINQKNPLDLLMNSEEEEKTYSVIAENLSSFEKKVFDLWIKSYSYKEMEELLRVNYKKIDNAIQRIKAKTSKIISENKQ